MQTYLKVAIGSGIILVLAIAVGFIGFPKLLNSMIRKQINLKPGSDTRLLWEKYPFFLNFSIYVFNVTNPDDVQRGGKPKLNEVGPFFFEEWKDKYDIEDVEDEDAVTYNMRNTYKFRPDLGLSGDVLLTIPHPLIQLVAISIQRDKAAMIPMVSKGLDLVFKPTSPFLQASFMDIFYRGIDVDCSSEDYSAKAICLNFHTDSVRGGFRVNETHFKFSLLGAGNHSDAGQFKVSRGINDSRRVGAVLQYQDEEELSNWDGDECNRYHGTDGTIFPALMRPEEGLWSFSADICRSTVAVFKKKVKYNGLPALRYVLDFGDVKNEPMNQCFCKEYPDNCPAKGTMDLSPCNELPMVMSHPHFLNGDPKLLENIEGLQPSEENHGIYIDFDIITGTPLSLAKRIQFNFDVEPIPDLAVMKDLQELVMPVFWIEEALSLNETYTDVLKKQVFMVINANNIFKWVATILGLVGLASAAYLFFSKSETISTMNLTSTQTEK